MSKREAIIQATIEVVAEKGITESPTILLAKRAGAAEYTIFRLFGSKNDLLVEVFEEVTARFRTALSPVIAQEQSIEEKLRALLLNGAAYYRRNPEELAYIQQYINSPGGEQRRPDILYEMGKDITRFLSISLLAQGKEQGFLKNLPMTALSGLVLAPVIMFLREEQILSIQHETAELNLLIEACLQGARA